MQFIGMICFHIFYHISYIFPIDIFKYYKNKKQKLYPKFYYQVCYTIGYPLIVSIFLPIISFKMNLPFLITFILYFSFGILFTKDNWIMYRKSMLNKADFIYSKYYELDPIFIRSYFKNDTFTLNEKITNKKKVILDFMKNYPYKIEIKRSKSINAYAYLQENKIVITEGCFNLSDEEIKAMLGHEIIHFKYEGKSNFKTLKKNFFIKLYALFLIFYLASILISFMPEIIQLLLIFVIIILIFCFIFFNIVMPERYLYQLSELRCDRLSCTLDGVSKEGMLSLLNRFKTMSKNKKEKYYLKMIRRYFLFEDHPNISYRIKRIEKYRNWTILDYIELPIHLLKQLIIGKGWNDE